MGVDAKLRLPCNVRVDSVAAVIAALYGHEKTNMGGFTRVSGYEIVTTSVPEMVLIKVIDPTVKDTQKYDTYHYFFECDEPGERFMMRRHGATTSKILKGVVDFFGGKLRIRDDEPAQGSNIYEVDYKSNEMNCPVKNHDYADLHKRILQLESVL